MADPVAPSTKKDVNDRLAEGSLPEDMLDGEPMVFDTIPPSEYVPLPDPPPMPGDDEKEPEPPKKSNGKGNGSGDGSGGRVTDARVYFMRPNFARGDHAEMADKLAVVLASDKSMLVYDEGKEYVYEPKTGAWEPIDDSIMRAIVKGFAGCPKKVKEGFIGLAVSYHASDGAVRMLNDETHAKDFFYQNRFGVTFMNGFLMCEEGETKLEPISPGNRARFAFPFDYDPDHKHPMLDKFLDDVFANCTEQEKQDRIMLLQEAAGAALFGLATVYQQALLLFGDGGTGKSQWADIMLSILPSSMCSATPPHKWAERFEVASLVGVALNVVAELPAAELVSTEIFKAVITGDYVSAEHKYAAPFKFRAKAMHMFMANKLPPTSDLTDAFFRRFVICPFERNMRDIPDTVKQIGAKIATSEREGIISWCVEGAVRLQRQNKYTVPAVGAEALAKWRIISDSVALFVDERCNPVPIGSEIRDGTKAKTLYNRYKEWAEAGKFKVVSSKTFSSRMESLRFYARKTTDGWYYPVQTKLATDES